MNEKEIVLIDNADKKRFEFDLEDKLGIIEYIIKEDKIFLTHTEVPEELGGKGYGRLDCSISIGRGGETKVETNSTMSLCSSFH